MTITDENNIFHYKYFKMIKESEMGIKLLNRPREWQQDERKREKKNKRLSWSSRGGYIQSPKKVRNQGTRFRRRFGKVRKVLV